MNKADRTAQDIRARMNGAQKADVLDTGEDPALLAKLQALHGHGKPKQIELLAGEDIRIGAFLLKPTGLVVDGEITRHDWEQTGKILKKLDSSMQWLIGDLIVCGQELKWGDQQTIADVFGFEYGTIRTYANVCRKVDLSIRIDKLDFAHHQLVSSMTTEEQSFWLQKAAAGDDGKRWSVARLRDEIKAANAEDEAAADLPQYLQPLRSLRNAYNPKKWAKLSSGEKHRIFSELKGYLLNMADELGETLADD